MSEKTVLAIDAGTVYTPGEKISPGRIIVEGGVIASVGPIDRVAAPPTAERIDATAHIVTPGFIEPHIHGCGGVDVMEATYDSLNVVSRIVARHGTTSFLATTVSSPAPILTNVVERLGTLVAKSFDGAQLLGIHLEGPFINETNRGTHQAANLCRPDAELLNTWIKASGSTIRLITIAPELDPAFAITTLAAQHGIHVAMGHSNASWEVASEVAGRGVCYAVHTFNAMRPFAHREPGIAGAVLTDDRIFAEIIADGVHVHPAAVRLLSRAKGRNRILLVTDATSATEMPDGEYVLGPNRVKVTHGVCRDLEGRLAGSTLTQELALKNYTDWTKVDFQDAVFAVTENPATALGLRDKGVIRTGSDADLTVIDSDCRVVKTFVAGKLVFER